MSEKSFGTMSRRGFLQASALAGATAALAGCSAGGEKTDTSAAPAADKYPIDAEEWGKGTVRHAEELLVTSGRETASPASPTRAAPR